MQFEPILVIRVYFILFIQSEYYNVYIIDLREYYNVYISRSSSVQRNLFKLLIMKLHNDSAYEYKLLMYKIRKNCGSDIRVNLGHQIAKFTKKEKKQIFLF